MLPWTPAVAADAGLEPFRRLGPLLALAGGLPFVALLAAIATLPLFAATARWWDRNGSKWAVAVLCAMGGIGFHLAVGGEPLRVLETAMEYLAFIALLTSLYTVSGGIHITGAYSGLPWLNTAFLALGALLANLVGTTGASMILVRPLLHANRRRRHKVHLVVFFIFIVGNGAGLLTPLGDPPLFLGFLKGVPLTWTFRLLPHWGLFLALLLTVFHFLDEIVFHREELETKHALVEDLRAAERPIHVQGWVNVAMLAGILAVVLASGHLQATAHARGLAPARAALAGQGLQVLLLGGITVAVLVLRRRPGGDLPFRRNHFHPGPMVEVAGLFLGIFGAMLPALSLVQAHASGWPIDRPWQLFWASGLLSSVLDNAPTYLALATLASARAGLDGASLAPLAQQAPGLLAAVACGSVFMGANTYIGNGPNLMVRAIAEQSGVEMPSFLGYMAWSGAVLLPLFLVLTFVFFR